MRILLTTLFLLSTLTSSRSVLAFTVTEAATLTFNDNKNINLEQVYAIPTQQIIPFIDVLSKNSWDGKLSAKQQCFYQFIVSVKPLWNVQTVELGTTAKPVLFLKLPPSIHPEFSRMMRFSYQEPLQKGRKCQSPAALIKTGKKFTGEFSGGEVVVNSKMKLDLQGPSLLAKLSTRENGTFGFASLTALKRAPQAEATSRALTFKIASQKTQIR